MLFAVPSDTATPATPSFRLEVFHTLGKCLQQCWQEGVFLSTLVHRFWKLTLQVYFKLYLDVLLKIPQWLICSELDFHLSHFTHWLSQQLSFSVLAADNSDSILAGRDPKIDGDSGKMHWE